MTKQYSTQWLDEKLRAHQKVLAAQIESQKYYDQENSKINARSRVYYTQNEEGESSCVEDPYKANNKLASGFMSLLVDQKVAYSVNEGLVGMYGDEQELENVLGADWRDDLFDTVQDASINGYGVWQIYLDEKGKEAYKRINPKQIIPCWDQDRELYAVIRTYRKLDTNDGKTIEVAEIWTDTEVIRYERKDSSKVWACKCRDAHLVETTSFGESVVEEIPKSWGRPPFVILRNNVDCFTDLKPIKGDVDAYDVVKSDFMNNLEDFQDVIWILKNYGGQSLGEMNELIKKYRMVPTDDDGEVTQQTTEIPVEARKEALMILRRDIYLFGKGVDTDSLQGNVTTVEIESMYNNLDLKANKVEKNTSKFLREVTRFYDETIPDTVKMSYDRSIILNRVALAELANQSVGSVSEETRLGDDPRVDNVQEEIKRMQAQNTSRVI